MDRRFSAALEFKFDEIEDIGFAQISFDELLRWFERKRIGKGIWQDIEDRWKDRNDTPLLVHQLRNSYLLAWGEGLEVTDKSWLQPIEQFSQSTEEVQ